MPGPGGGGRGGGGFSGGGGSRGGGYRGGGYHGGPRGPRRRRRWGWGFGWGPGFFWGPGYYAGGLFGAIMGIMLLPVILVVIAAFILFAAIGGAVGAASSDGVIRYEEKDFQDYANSQYSEAFGSSTAYEDNILLVFVTTKDADGLAYIAWVGDHINLQINNAFDANNNSAFQRAIASNLSSQDYWYTLGSGIARTVNSMTQAVASLGAPSFENGNAVCNDTAHVQVSSYLVNKTDFSVPEATVNEALEAFTAETEIPIVVVVDNAESVFGVDYSAKIVGIVICVVLVVIALLLVAAGVRRYRKYKNNGGGKGGDASENTGANRGSYNGGTNNPYDGGGGGLFS